MRVKFIQIAALVLLSFMQIGCSTSGPLYDKQKLTPEENKKISMSDYEVIINDRRPDTTKAELDVSLVTVSGEEEQISPVFSKELKDLLKATIEQYRIPGSRFLVFDLDIIEGHQGYSCALFSESEFVSWKIRIGVREKGSENQIDSSEGLCWGKRTSYDASAKRISEMYNKSFKLAVIDALNNLKLN